MLHAHNGFLYAGVLLKGMLLGGAAEAAPGQTIQYPPARHSEVVEDYHGTRVPDPYRWLEEPDAPETRAWIEAENRVTESYLAQIPQRATLRQRLTQLWNYPKYGAPFHKAGRYFFFKNDGLQNQSVLYKQASLVAGAEVLLDPNVLSQDGTVALSTLAVSEDGKLLAYGTSASGSDWEEFHVRDIASGRDRSDHLRWIKFSGASWTYDGRGFFYSRYPEAAEKALTSVNRFQKVYYHRLGTEQAQDALVYERPDQPDWGFGAQVTDDGRYVVMNVWLGTDRRNRVYYLDLRSATRPTVRGAVARLLDDFDASYGFIGNHGPVFYFLTDLDAPRKRVIAIDTRQPERAHWREVIPQGEDVLEGVQIIHDAFVAHYMHDAHSRLRLFALGGQFLKDVALPTLGAVASISGERKDDEMFYAFTSFLYPTTIFRYDFKEGTSSVFKAPAIDFDPSGYETKQDVFDDFLAAAEYLIAQGYTRPAKLAIGGGSNGGLLVGAAITQRPELFGAALPAVGVMDMLRFHKFTIGWAWVTEYGSADSAAQFPYLYKYSPLHNLKAGTRYPATLITTADHDDRVVPGHSFKFAAALQAAQAGPAPVLSAIETKAGPGAGTPTSKVIEEQADRWAFLVRNLGMEVGGDR